MDGHGTLARFDTPYGIAIDQYNDLIFVAEDQTIRKITFHGIIIKQLC